METMPHFFPSSQQTSSRYVCVLQLVCQRFQLEQNQVEKPVNLSDPLEWRSHMQRSLTLISSSRQVCAHVRLAFDTHEKHLF